MPELRTDILIVGAGFAGAATACHLSRLTDQSILLVEKEDVPGYHASGRNASLLRQSIENREIRELIVNSREAYAGVGGLVLSGSGSYLLGTAQQLQELMEPQALSARIVEPGQVREQITLLRGHEFERALFTPTDAVIDIAGLLQYYLKTAREHSVQVLLSCRVEEINSDGRFRVKTNRGEVRARYVINAAGAWAAEVAAMARATPLPLTPLKRHLFLLGDVAGMPADWPFVWNLTENFYFRPESGQLLFSLCDEQLSRSLEPTVEPEIAEDLAELIWRELPSLQDVMQKRVWSCFRTKTPDGKFVLGWDPVVPDFFWVAGLGGHGMGASWEVGRLAADVFLDRPLATANPFDPARFSRT